MEREDDDSTTTEFPLTGWSETLRRGWAPPEDEDVPGSDSGPDGPPAPELPAPVDLAEMGREMARLGVPSVEEGGDIVGETSGRLGVAHAAPGPEPGREPVPGYRLVSRLGAGASGEVWKAIGPGGIPVALKFVRLGEEDDRPDSSIWRARRDGLRSLELMREVRHPNLLTLFGAWYSHGQLVIGMELADGTLMDRADEAADLGLPGIPLPELIEAMRQAACGIDFLNEPRHALLSRERVGIQHRDIKPQNLLRVGDGIKVGDFGQAKLLEDSILNTGCLTPAYAAPEFFRGFPSTRSDQYSLAVTYCRLRGGRLPFTGNRWEVMLGHCQGEPDLTMLPEAERPPVAQALAKDPALRWPDCRALIAALSAAAGPGVSAPALAPSLAADRPDLALAPGTPKPRRIPAWAVPGLIPAAILLGLAVSRLVPSTPVTAVRPRTVASRVPEASKGVEPPPTVDLVTRFRAREGSPAEPEIPLAGPVDWVAQPLDVPDTPATPAAPAHDEALRALALRALAVAGPEGVRADGPRGGSTTRTATVQILMPIEKAVLYIPNDKVHLVGLGNPDDWYGPRRVVHTRPLSEEVDFEVGAFWTDARGRQLSRTVQGRVVPGRTYRVDLRTAEPAWTEVGPSPTSSPSQDSHP